jgi:hypothetical protein
VKALIGNADSQKAARKDSPHHRVKRKSNKQADGVAKKKSHGINS